MSLLAVITEIVGHNSDIWLPRIVISPQTQDMSPMPVLNIVGPASHTLDQHYNNIQQCVLFAGLAAAFSVHWCIHQVGPTSNKVDLILIYRLRCWSNIKPTLGECLFFSEHMYIFLVSYFISGFGAGNKMIDPHVILAMPFNFILRSSHLYYRNTQFLLWQCHLTWF